MVKNNTRKRSTHKNRYGNTSEEGKQELKIDIKVCLKKEDKKQNSI